MQKELEQKEINQTINFHCGCVGGETGVAPTIGENGNWFIGEEDTGVKAQGEDGKSAYGVALEAGFTGTVEKWLESLKGAAGEAGAKGEKGDPGEIGANGATGLQGLAGVNGFFSAMDVLFEGQADTEGTTYNLIKPITDYKVIAVEYGFSGAVPPIAFGTSFEWIVNPQVSSSIRCYRGIRMIDPSVSGANQRIIFWNFPTSLTFSVTAKLDFEKNNGFAILKIYGIK